jgi:hypothetical protein
MEMDPKMDSKFETHPTILKLGILKTKTTKWRDKARATAGQLLMLGNLTHSPMLSHY